MMINAHVNHNLPPPREFLRQDDSNAEEAFMLSLLAQRKGTPDGLRAPFWRAALTAGSPQKSIGGSTATPLRPKRRARIASRGPKIISGYTFNTERWTKLTDVGRVRVLWSVWLGLSFYGSSY